MKSEAREKSPLMAANRIERERRSGNSACGISSERRDKDVKYARKIEERFAIERT